MDGDVINIKVKPNSTSNKVLGVDEQGFLMVNIKAPAQKGKANKELVRLLSKHFKKRVEIISGLKSREKKILLRLSNITQIGLSSNLSRAVILIWFSVNSFIQAGTHM